MARRITADPINPQPPVTRIFKLAYLSLIHRTRPCINQTLPPLAITFRRVFAGFAGLGFGGNSFPATAAR